MSRDGKFYLALLSRIKKGGWGMCKLRKLTLFPDHTPIWVADLETDCQTKERKKKKQQKIKSKQNNNNTDLLMPILTLTHYRTFRPS